MTPIVNIVGGSGYAATLARQAERFAATGLCTLGAAVVPPPPTTAETAYDAVVDARRNSGWTVYGSLDEVTATVEVASPAASDRILLLPVPIPLHRPLAIAGLEAGFHVLCEKPAAGSLEDLHAMAEKARETGRNLWFGFQHPLMPAMATLTDMVAAEAIGRLREVVVVTSWPRPEAYYRRAPWVGRIAVDGRPVLDSPIQNAMAHFLHAALHVAMLQGYQPRRVTAEHARINDIETADTQVLRIETADQHGAAGPIVYFAGTHAGATPRDPAIEIIGTGGRLRWRFPDALDAAEGDGRYRVLRHGTERPGEVANGAALNGAILTLSGRSDPGVRHTNLVGVSGAHLHLSVVVAAFGDQPATRFPGPPVPSSVWKREETDETTVWSIGSMDDDLERLVAGRSLPSEAAVSWASSVVHVETDLPIRRV